MRLASLGDEEIRPPLAVEAIETAHLRRGGDEIRRVDRIAALLIADDRDVTLIRRPVTSGASLHLVLLRFGGLPEG